MSSEQVQTAGTGSLGRRRRWSAPISAIATALVVAVVAIALGACTEVAQPTSTPVVFEPTSAPAGTRAQVLAGGDPLLIAMLSQPQELPEGDAASGEELYTSLGCVACHTLTDEMLVGPGFRGVYERAATRTDLSAEDYLVESITQPAAFVVEGFTNSMQVFDYLSDQELADLVAFLQTVR